MIYKYETNTATYYYEGEEALKQGVWSSGGWSLMTHAFLVIDNYDQVLKDRYGMRILINMFTSQDICAVKPIREDV